MALTLSVPLLFKALNEAWQHISADSAYDPSYYTGPLLGIPLLLFTVDLFRQISRRTFYFSRSVLGFVLVCVGFYHSRNIFIPEYEACLIILGCVLAMVTGLLCDIRFVISRYPELSHDNEPLLRPEYLGLFVGFSILAAIHVYLFSDVLRQRLDVMSWIVHSLQESSTTALKATEREKASEMIAYSYTVLRRSSVLHGLSLFVAFGAIGFGIWRGQKRANQSLQRTPGSESLPSAESDPRRL